MDDNSTTTRRGHWPARPLVMMSACFILALIRDVQVGNIFDAGLLALSAGFLGAMLGVSAFTQWGDPRLMGGRAARNGTPAQEAINDGR